eukprot:jgi/Mesvir1/5574/Mv15594-RA.1
MPTASLKSLAGKLQEHISRFRQRPADPSPAPSAHEQRLIPQEILSGKVDLYCRDDKLLDEWPSRHAQWAADHRSDVDGRLAELEFDLPGRLPEPAPAICREKGFSLSDGSADFGDSYRVYLHPDDTLRPAAPVQRSMKRRMSEPQELTKLSKPKHFDWMLERLVPHSVAKLMQNAAVETPKSSPRLASRSGEHEWWHSKNDLLRVLITAEYELISGEAARHQHHAVDIIPC